VTHRPARDENAWAAEVLGYLLACPNQAVRVELRNAVLAALVHGLFAPEWLLEHVGLEELIPPLWLTDTVERLWPGLLDQTTEEAPE